MRLSAVLTLSTRARDAEKPTFGRRAAIVTTAICLFAVAPNSWAQSLAQRGAPIRSFDLPIGESNQSAAGPWANETTGEQDWEPRLRHSALLPRFTAGLGVRRLDWPFSAQQALEAYARISWPLGFAPEREVLLAHRALREVERRRSRLLVRVLGSMQEEVANSTREGAELTWDDLDDLDDLDETGGLTPGPDGESQP